MADVPPEVVTVTSTEPAAGGRGRRDGRAGVDGDVGGGEEPKSTVALDPKLVPVIVTTVPPSTGPEAGLRAATVGIPMAAAGGTPTARGKSIPATTKAANTTRRASSAIGILGPDSQKVGF